MIVLDKIISRKFVTYCVRVDYLISYYIYSKIKNMDDEIVQNSGVKCKFTVDKESRLQSVLVEEWSEDEVREWFLVNRINKEIVDLFEPCSGNTLKQLFRLRRDAPEFYFQYFSNKINNKINLKTILEFTQSLEVLFNF